MNINLVVKPTKQIFGISRYSNNLEFHLKRIGIDVRVINSSIPNVLKPISKLLRPAGFDLDSFFETYPINIDNSSDSIYHLTNETLASVLNFRKIKPCLVTVHGIYGYVFRNSSTLSIYPHLPEKYLDSLSVRGLKFADEIIVVSNFLKNILMEYVGIPHEKINVVYESVNHNTFKPIEVPKYFWGEQGLNSNNRYVLYVGSEKPGKNFHLLLRSFSKVKQRLKEKRLHLLKVGMPEIAKTRNTTYALVKKLGIEENVTFVGHKDCELPYYYNIAEIFVFPSLYEGFGFPPLESMACGTPVVCSSAGALPEVVGDAALLFDPRDEDTLIDLMTKLLLEKELREEYRSRGLDQAKKFSWSHTAEETIKIYNQVLGM